ncbi:hypothetical protein Hanom_Chr10g00887951 [Helianthus anomalus]
MPFDFLFILLFILSCLLASIPDYRSLRKCSLSFEMQTHDLIGSTNELLSYKNSWDAWLTP